MKIMAFVTALVLGTSSLAGAATTSYAPFELRTLPALDVGWIQHVVEKPAPRVLMNDTRVSGKTTFKVNEVRTFTKVELRANDGSTPITRVIIDYGNGRTRTVKLGATVTGAKTLSFDVSDSHAIKSMTIVGSGRRGTTIDVLAA